MTLRHRVVVGALLAWAACGKSTKEPAATEPKVTDIGAPAEPANKAPDKPAAPPVKAATRGPEHPVYSLVDNRLSAHLTRGGGLVVMAGSAGFAKYVRIANMMRKDAKKSWDLRQTEGEIKVARLTGKSGAVFVPLTPAQAGRNTLRIRAFAKADGVISVRVNDTSKDKDDEDKHSRKEINGKLTAGWSTAEFTLPEGTLKEGENAIQIFTKESGVAVAWLQFAAQTPIADDGATRFYDPSTKSLLLPKDGAMTWFAAVPEHAKVTGDLADGNCKVHVLATAEDGSTAQGDLVGMGSAVDLVALAGKAARIELSGVGCNETQLASAALVIPGDPAQVKRGEPPKYVVFIIMDSLRADRVRAFDAKARPEAPNWEKLAESSATFMNTYVQGNESQVSHAAIWSANYLAKHRAIEMRDKLADRWTTIDEVAKKAGKYVAGASGNGYIRPSRGFGSAWDQYANHIEKSLGLKGADIMDKGLSFVAPKKDQPWFLYLGFIDTHVTWRAKQPWMDKYDGGYKGRFTMEYGDDGPNGSNGKDLTDKEKDHVRALYDSNVSYQDDLLGHLVEKLKSWGIYDQTMIIITADHGDEQWEDGRVGHGGSQRETLVHVPLMIHYPPLFPAGRVTEGAEGIDIVPTLADALGVATDPEWQGASLIPVANGAGGYPLMSFSSQYENGHVGRIGHWKLKLMGTGAPHLYNLAKDRDERKDLWGSATASISARLLLDPMWILRQWNVEWKKAQWGNAAAVSSRFASDLGE